jgi:hypothetical protein
MGRPIFFCHIPKTAGTTLRLALERRFSADEIFPSPADFAANRGQYPSLQYAADRIGPSIKLLSGHYPLSARRMLKHPIVVMMLREPIARSISHLKHTIAHTSTEQAERILEALDKGHMPFPDNLMTRYLCGEIEHPAVMVVKAVAILETIPFLGTVEHMDIFIPQMRALGVDIPNEHHNRTAVDIDLTARQRETIHRHNAIDMLVYECALDMVA